MFRSTTARSVGNIKVSPDLYVFRVLGVFEGTISENCHVLQFNMGWFQLCLKHFTGTTSFIVL